MTRQDRPLRVAGPEDAPAVTDADRFWAHYMGCGALATVERLADLLRCREDEVYDVVRVLAGRRPVWRPSRHRRWWYRMDSS